ncbi:MAG TPA: LPXTG cell wall anchor domain-containing protein [Devosia sp.]|nr:LPXTG cell wall anchor domain-containing protein [Devosia sp.]
MKYLFIAFGLVLVLLGGLWFLQGTGLVTMAPILCVGDCEPLEDPSLPWALAGLVALLAGAALLWRSRRR